MQEQAELSGAEREDRGREAEGERKWGALFSTGFPPLLCRDSCLEGSHFLCRRRRSGKGEQRGGGEGARGVFQSVLDSVRPESLSLIHALSISLEHYSFLPHHRSSLMAWLCRYQLEPLQQSGCAFAPAPRWIDAAPLSYYRRLSLMLPRSCCLRSSSFSSCCCCCSPSCPSCPSCPSGDWREGSRPRRHLPIIPGQDAYQHPHSSGDEGGSNGT